MKPLLNESNKMITEQFRPNNVAPKSIFIIGAAIFINNSTNSKIR